MAGETMRCAHWHRGICRKRITDFRDAITGTWSNFKGMNYGKYTDNDC
jgi:hypothetical protein